MNNSTSTMQEEQIVQAYWLFAKAKDILLDGDHLILSAVITLGTQMCFLILPIKIENHLMFTTGINTIVIALTTLLLGQTPDPRQLMVTVFVCVWAMRLTSYHFRRSLAMEKDERYYVTKWSVIVKGLLFMTDEVVWMFLLNLPLIMVNASRNSVSQGSPQPMTMLDIIGATLFIMGLTIETISEGQKFHFRQNSSNAGVFVNKGLWYYSRHPNLFGNIILWWGIFIICINVIQGLEWLVIISPLYNMTMILFVTGLPPLEEVTDYKYIHLSDYQLYKKSTSPLIPVPPSTYLLLPTFLKRTLFYRHIGTKKEIQTKKGK